MTPPLHLKLGSWVKGGLCVAGRYRGWGKGGAEERLPAGPLGDLEPVKTHLGS